MSAAVIRRARAGDEESLAKVHIQSWQETYRGIVPQVYLDELPRELDERIEMWTKILASPERWTWVAEVSGKIVGFILFGPPRDENREGYIELGAIYLLAAYQGQGIGYSLLSAGFKFMKDLGYQKSYCWMIEGNPTAQFYERTGAVFLGSMKVDEVGGQTFREFAYEWSSLRRLTPPPIRPELREGDPLYQEYAEDLSMWREQTISLLPQIRKEKKEAAARGDQAEVDRLQKEYQEILDLLSKH